MLRHLLYVQLILHLLYQRKKVKKQAVVSFKTIFPGKTWPQESQRMLGFEWVENCKRMGRVGQLDAKKNVVGNYFNTNKDNINNKLYLKKMFRQSMKILLYLKLWAMNLWYKRRLCFLQFYWVNGNSWIITKFRGEKLSPFVHI